MRTAFQKFAYAKFILQYTIATSTRLIGHPGSNLTALSPLLLQLPLQMLRDKLASRYRHRLFPCPTDLHTRLWTSQIRSNGFDRRASRRIDDQTMSLVREFAQSVRVLTRGGAEVPAQSREVPAGSREDDETYAARLERMPDPEVSPVGAFSPQTTCEEPGPKVRRRRTLPRDLGGAFGFTVPSVPVAGAGGSKRPLAGLPASVLNQQLHAAGVCCGG